MHLMRILLYMSLFLSFIAPALAQSDARITAFAVDRQSITPDEAESGTAPVNLTWTTQQLRAGQNLKLQVLVLGSWIDAQSSGSAPLSATGSLRWIVPHTLDFIPPTFRLVILDAAQKMMDERELVIPYVNLINPSKPPRIVSFTTPDSIIHGSSFRNTNFTLPVSFQAANRPARANLVFEQVLDDGRVVNVELPRFHRWIRSGGNGTVKPAADGGEILLRLSMVNIDTGEVYAQQTLTITVMPDTLPQPVPQPTQPGGGISPTPTTRPGAADVLFLRANSYNVRRGEKITLTWEVKNATKIWLEVYDIDFFPRNASIPPLIKQENLPATGSTELTIPADYRGGGWQVHLLAEGSPPGYDFGRVDLVFTDAEQPVFMNVNNFSVSAEAVRRGDVITVSWDAYVTSRTSNQGVIQQVAISGYENKVFLNVGNNGQGEVIPEVAQTFRSLPLKHSMQMTIPNAHPTANRVILTLGLTGVPIQGVPTDVSSGILSLNLLPLDDTTKTEMVGAAFQQFEGGMMIWNASTGAVTVYFGQNGGEFMVFPLSSYSGLPDNALPDAPPDGRLKPINAFGRVWGNNPGIRTPLGWAVTGETGYTMTIVTRLDSGEIVIVTLPNERRVYMSGANWNF